MSDHDWRMEFDGVYKDEYDFITTGDYEDVVKAYSGDEEFNFSDLEIYVVKRLKNKDMPLFVCRQWISKEANEEFSRRLKKEINHRLKKEKA
jgi:hypothetical protein